MELDKGLIKTLASESRIEILKSLSKRRKMPAEISKEMQLAPSTVVEHLAALEGAGLVRKEETQHKWVYYALTEKGQEITKPATPFNLILMLVFAILTCVISVINYTSNVGGMIAAGAAKGEALTALPTAAAHPSALSQNLVLFLAALSAIVVIYTTYKIFKR